VPGLEADYKEYCRIVEYMVHNGASLICDPNWLRADDRSEAQDSYDKRKALQFAEEFGGSESKSADGKMKFSIFTKR